MSSIRTVVLFAAMPVSPAFAVTLEVPTDYPTVQAAIDAAGPGDTVHLAAGLFRESIELSSRSDLTLEGEGAGETILEPDPSSWFILSVASSSGLTIRGMTLQNASAGIELFQCHDLILEALALEELTWSIDSVGGSYGVVVRDSSFSGGTLGVHSLWDWPDAGSTETTFVVEDNLFAGTWTGILIDSSSASVLRRNTFLDVQNIGIALNSWDGHLVYENLFDGGPVGILMTEYDDEFYPPDFSTPSRSQWQQAGGNRIAGERDVSIFNNIFIGTTLAGVYGFLTPAHDGVFRLRNNIFYENSGAAVLGDTGAGPEGQDWDSQLSIAYDTFYGNSTDFDGSVSARGKRGSSRNLFRDPLFTAPDTGDFSLQTGSTSIDSGTLDIDGDGVADLTEYSGRSRDRGIEER